MNVYIMQNVLLPNRVIIVRIANNAVVIMPQCIIMKIISEIDLIGIPIKSVIVHVIVT